MDGLGVKCDGSVSCKKIVSLAITQDTACYFSYISWKSLQSAIRLTYERKLGLKFKLEHRPYRVDPSLSDDVAVRRDEWMRTKFGAERYACFRMMMDAKGKEVGIEFDHDGPLRRTGPCHRLLRYAYAKQQELCINSGAQLRVCPTADLQARLLDEIFSASFERAEDVGDELILAELAQKTGLCSREEALELLASSAYTEEVEAIIADGRQRYGINGTPHVIINNKWAIQGGQPTEFWYQIFEKIANCS